MLLDKPVGIENVSSFRRSSPNKALKPYTVKNVIGYVLQVAAQPRHQSNFAWNFELQGLLTLFVL